MNCQASEFGLVQGSTIHPSTSSICVAAVLDGIISPSGIFRCILKDTFRFEYLPITPRG